MRPQTRYAHSGDVSIAYQVVGEGPIDLIVVPGWISHVDFAWEDPLYGEWMRRLAAFSRAIVFDKRGTGLSDRDVGDSTLEERMDDLRAVLAAAGRSGRPSWVSRKAARSPSCSPRPTRNASRRSSCMQRSPGRAKPRTTPRAT